MNKAEWEIINEDTNHYSHGYNDDDDPDVTIIRKTYAMECPMGCLILVESNAGSSSMTFVPGVKIESLEDMYFGTLVPIEGFGAPPSGEEFHP